MHGADVDRVGLPALPPAEAELFVWCVQRPFLAGQKEVCRCTNHPDLPNCRAEANEVRTAHGKPCLRYPGAPPYVLQENGWSSLSLLA